MKPKIKLRTSGSCALTVYMPVECGGEVDLKACHAPLKPRLIHAGHSVHHLIGGNLTLTCDWETNEPFDHSWRV